MSTINLLPSDYVRQRSRRRANVVCIALFVIVTTSVVCASVFSERSHRHSIEVRDRVDREYAEATKIIEQVQFLESQKQKMLQKAKLTATLVERIPRSMLLAILADARPKNTSLLELEMIARPAKKRQSAESADSSGSRYSVTSRKEGAAQPREMAVTMKITGLAGTDGDVARFIANLDRNPLVGLADLVYSQERVERKTTVREFQIMLEMKSDASEADFRKAISAVRAAGAAGRRRTEIGTES